MKSEGPFITRIAALDITEASHGNGNGLGIVDFTTDRAFRKFSFERPTPTLSPPPCRRASESPWCSKTTGWPSRRRSRPATIADFRNVRLGRIKNTLEAHLLEVFENLPLRGAVKTRDGNQSDPCELAFDERGSLF